MSHALLALLLLALTLTESHSQKQGATLLKTDILCVLAHPDDETGMASTLAYYAHERDAIIANVYCTRGEGGGNMVGTHWGRSLGVLREVELQQCLTTLGVKHFFFLEQLDWAYTESAAMTLEKWDHEATLGHLVRLIRNLRPEVILTMNPFPRPGQHGHHQAAGMLAVEAYTAAGDPNSYPDQLKREGLATWQARKLYFRGDSAGTVAKITPGSDAHTIAGEALRNHRSQGFGRFQRATVGRPPEAFGLIKSVLATNDAETDLLAGLPLQKDQEATVIVPEMAVPNGVALRFKPRPALTQFRTWARSQKIDHLMTKIPSDLPVVAGQANTVSVLLENNFSDSREVTLQFECPPGWALEKESLKLTLKPDEKREVSASVTPPAAATENVPLRATISESSGFVETSLHPVPSTTTSKLTFTPKIDGSSTGWSAVSPILITPSQRVQGKAENAADLSAEVRTGYDQNHFYIDVLVKDDTIVFNIAPNDIRGHWRTDTIEICVDPTANSEHTLTCFKVGIFPFDLEGNTRAARDADANQGPIEETALGMSTKAVRTEDGYRVQSSIPWEIIGIDSPKKGQQLGFNVILYDGDKADAAIGENINECRLAWAPRSGVQGRPEDWGRLTLD